VLQNVLFILNNLIHRETVEIQHEETAIQAIQEQTAIHKKTGMTK